MDSIAERMMGILTNPQHEWDVIKKEKITVAEMMTRYAVFMAAITPVSLFIGYSLVGSHGNRHIYKYAAGNGIAIAVLTYVLLLVGVLVLSFIIDLLAPYFGAKRDIVASAKVAIFSSTASWVGGVFYMLPALELLCNLFDIYSIVLLYMGIKKIKHPPKDNTPGYFILTLAAAVVYFFIIQVAAFPSHW